MNTGNVGNRKIDKSNPGNRRKSEQVENNKENKEKCINPYWMGKRE